MRGARFLVVAGLLLRFSAASAQVCEHQFKGHCYQYVSGTITQAQAVAACAAQFNGVLASIHSKALNEFLSDVVDPQGSGGITGWIGGVSAGGFCSGANADYTWLDSSSWDYENWRAGEPNCSPSGAAGCMQFWPDTNGGLSGWNDVPCIDSLDGFICQFPATSQAPVNSAAGLIALVALMVGAGMHRVRGYKQS